MNINSQIKHIYKHPSKNDLLATPTSRPGPQLELLAYPVSDHTSTEATVENAYHPFLTKKKTKKFKKNNVNATPKCVTFLFDGLSNDTAGTTLQEKNLFVVQFFTLISSLAERQKNVWSLGGGFGTKRGLKTKNSRKPGFRRMRSRLRDVRGEGGSIRDEAKAGGGIFCSPPIAQTFCGK